MKITSGVRAGLVVVFALAVLAGCAGKGEPNAVGTVGTIQSANADSVSFLMQEEDINSPMNNALITVAAADLEGSTPTELATGDAVRVWAQVCAQSFPPQCQATSVVVDD